MLSLFTTGIYGYLDLVLIGWALGLVWLAGRALLKKVPFAQKVRSGLGEEVYLFGNWAAPQREEIGGWLFLVSMALLQFDMFFMNSYVRESGAGWYAFLAPKLEIVYFWLIIVKMVFFTRYSGLQLGAGFCFLFVFRWVFLNNGHFWPVVGMLYFLAAKDIRTRRTLKVCLAVSAASFFAVVFSAAMGWIGTIQYNAGNRIRDSFGYGWYNLTGAILLSICIMYVCWRQVNKLKWFDFALLAAAMVFCDRGPDSRAAAICIALLIVLAALLRFLPGVARPVWVRVVVSAAPAMAFAVSLLGGWLYKADSPVWVKLDILLSNRLSYTSQALVQSSIAIAGQRLTDSGFLVDNLYANLWLYGGPVESLLFWGAVTVLLWRLLKKGALTENACLVVLLAHAVMETHFAWPCINVVLWLLPCVLYLLPEERVQTFAPKEKQI